MRSIAWTVTEESGKLRSGALEAALAHSKKDEIIAAYNRAKYLTERVVLMQWLSDYVQAQRLKAIAAWLYKSNWFFQKNYKNGCI